MLAVCQLNPLPGITFVSAAGDCRSFESLTVFVERIQNRIERLTFKCTRANLSRVVSRPRHKAALCCADHELVSTTWAVKGDNETFAVYGSALRLSCDANSTGCVTHSNNLLASIFTLSNPPKITKKMETIFC